MSRVPFNARGNWGSQRNRLLKMTTAVIGREECAGGVALIVGRGPHELSIVKLHDDSALPMAITVFKAEFVESFGLGPLDGDCRHDISPLLSVPTELTAPRLSLGASFGDRQKVGIDKSGSKGCEVCRVGNTQEARCVGNAQEKGNWQPNILLK